MNRRPAFRWSTVLLSALAVVWIYPVFWTLANAFKRTADLYAGPLSVPIPPVVGNLGEAWDRAHLGAALLNSTYVAALTVAGALLLAVPAAFALTRLRPPARGPLLLLILAPLIIPTEVLIVPLFSIYRTLGSDQQPDRAGTREHRVQRVVRDRDPGRLLPPDPAGRHRRGGGSMGRGGCGC